MKQQIKYTLFFLMISHIVLSQIMNPQSKEITEKFFSDFDFVENTTPALKKKKGYTNYKELIAFLTNLTQKHPKYIKLSFIGESQKGKKIPIVYLTNPNNKEKIKVWMQGGLHGDEPASSEGMLYLLDRLLNDSKYTCLLDSVNLAVVPMANIDGYLKMKRHAANGLDLNRDQTKLMAPETIALKHAYNKFLPEVAIDFHEYKPFRKHYTRLGHFGITGMHDVMFLVSGNLNVPKGIRNLTDNLFIKNSKDSLDKYKLTYNPYMTSKKVKGEIQFSLGSLNARSSATNFALTNTISSLIEVRGVGLGKTSFKRRIYTAFLIASSYIKTASEHKNKIKEHIKKATSVKNKIVVTSNKTVSKGQIKTIDIDANEIISLDVTKRDGMKAKPKLTRLRPVAYLIDADQKEIVEKLRTLGVIVEQLLEAKAINVDTYNIESYKRDSFKSEKLYRQTVTTKLISKEIEFKKGTYIVYMNQRKSNIVPEILEPEAVNSLVSLGVFKTVKGTILPMYRILDK